MSKTLKQQLIEGFSPDPTYGIYADAPFSEDSECRIGQVCFENGGVLDDKQFVCNLESIEYRIDLMIDEESGEVDYQREVAVESLIQEMEDDRLFRESVKGLY